MTSALSISKRAVAVLVVVAITISGCVTSNGNMGATSQTAIDRAIGQCIGSALISTTVGALVGNQAFGKDGAWKGAAAGAAVGVGICAILMQVAADEDRAKLREAELAAIQANASRTTSFYNKNRKQVSVTTIVTDAPVIKSVPNNSAIPMKTDAKFTNCRYARSTLSVEQQSVTGESQLWCRRDTGDWTPINN